MRLDIDWRVTIIHMVMRSLQPHGHESIQDKVDCHAERQQT